MKTILIVDDIAAIRSALRSYFESFGQEFQICGEAHDGLEAVAKARDLHPDLVILDFAMPEMNGIQAAEVLTREMPTVPLVLFTMHAGSTVEARARAAGFRAVISKADDSSELLRVVRMLVADPQANYQAPGI